MRVKKELKRVIAIGFFLAAVVIGSSKLARAQYSGYQDALTMISPVSVPYENERGDFLVDNFEYWDVPWTHGWETSEYRYPVGGMPFGFLVFFRTALDLEQGSRVLDVYAGYNAIIPASDWQLTTKKVIKDPGVQADLLWMDIRAPLGIEWFTRFKIIVLGTTGTANDPDQGEYPFAISFIPNGFNQEVDLEAVQSGQFDFSRPENTSRNPFTVEVPIGRNYQDGSWHTLKANLSAIISKASQDHGLVAGRIKEIRIIGNEYRLDNLWLMKDSTPVDGEAPYLFKIGPQSAQIFQPFEYYCYAKDADLNYQVFLDIWQNEYELRENDPNAVNISRVRDLTSRFIRADGKAHPGHISNPDPGGIAADRDTLFWTATVGGWGAHGSAATFLSPVPIANSKDAGGKDICIPERLLPQLLINPYRPCMVDLPTPYDPARILADPDSISAYDPQTIPYTTPGAGGVRLYHPRAVAEYGNYLLDLGFTTWPHIACLNFTPQVLENLVITVQVHDAHGRTDVETFPLSVVNYPVSNHPPKLEILHEQMATVGEPYRYQLVATDQDWLNPDGSWAGDQLNLTWKATIDEWPAYQYGPWAESLINPATGEIAFTPEFEGMHRLLVQVTDARGLMACGYFEILATTPGSWLNHSPRILRDFNDTAPLVIRAGQLFILGPPMLDFRDPDNEELYYSCNIGSMVIDTDERGRQKAYWTFQTNFPGLYRVEITAFDQRGGLATSRFLVDVQPWWSF
ncbi:MAG: hypothetical protein AB1611_20835 [bacterium]